MIERFWCVARLVCLVRGHNNEIIGMSTLHPVRQCRRCARTQRL